MKSRFVKLVVFVPKTHAEKVRAALGAAGAGRLGNYSYCSFSSDGVGRYLPGKAARPARGARGHLARVREERIEVLCEKKELKHIIAAMKRVHPYEEIAFDVYQLDTL